MRRYFVKSQGLPRVPLWKKMQNNLNIASFGLELTARCNNNCRHCYINLPSNDALAKSKELKLDQIKEIIDQAANLGILWCLLTGGEPLLRKDFIEIYVYLKKKGFFVNIFTNACLITERHIDIFKKYPPRSLEITAYGATKETYENVTRVSGSYEAFMRGLKLLTKNKIRNRLKIVVMRSNLHELPEMMRFCRRGKDILRIDPYLHLRVDRDSARNKEIVKERLFAEEIVRLESVDSQLLNRVQKACQRVNDDKPEQDEHSYLFHCDAGKKSFNVSYDGYFHACLLADRDCVYDLRKGSLEDAVNKFMPKLRSRRFKNAAFIRKCRTCSLMKLCLSCPARAYLESGKIEKPVNYFCELAHVQAEACGISLS